MVSEPLAIPLELIERILKLAFLPVEPPSLEVTEPTPPRSTSHLLLVSKAIRQICLPFFWRSITVAKPQDWITLFHPETGLVVVGKEGEERWEMVQELKIVLEAVVPVGIKTRETFGKTLAASIRLPEFRQIPRVLFQHLPPSLELTSWMEDQDREALLDEARHLLLNILQHLHPLYISAPLLYWEDIDIANFGQVNIEFPGYAPEVEITNTTLDNDYEPLLDELNPVCIILGIFSNFRARMVGFQEDWEDEMQRYETWVRREGAAQAVEQRWSSTWTWERKDGTTFFIDFATLWT